MHPPKMLFQLALCLLGGALNAQTGPPDTLARAPKAPIQHEWSVSSDLLFQVVVDSARQNPYLFNYRQARGHKGLRFSLGGRWRNDLQKMRGFNDSYRTQSLRLYTRLGLDHEKTLGKRWRGRIGLDVLYRYQSDLEITDSGFDAIRVSNKAHGVGGGVSGEVQFQITSRFGCSLQSAWYLGYTYTRSGRFFDKFPALNDLQIITRSTGFEWLPPTSVFFYFKL
jgi:hypothetical protein